MIASLPMYWREETADLWQDFWGCVQSAAKGRGLSLPDLTPPEALPKDWTDHWLRPDLGLSMTCGLPFRTVLKDRVTYVATLGFGLDAPAGQYFSQVIARKDLASQPPRRLAYNSADSQSGWAAAQAHPALPGITGYVETGSHALSLAAVADGRADIAFVDAVTWRLLERIDPNASRVTVISQTAPTPALPLITAKGRDPAPLRAALKEAVEGFVPHDAIAMGGPLSFQILAPQQYFEVPTPAAPSV